MVFLLIGPPLKERKKRYCWGAPLTKPPESCWQLLLKSHFSATTVTAVTFQCLLCAGWEQTVLLSDQWWGLRQEGRVQCPVCPRTEWGLKPTSAKPTLDFPSQLPIKPVFGRLYLRSRPPGSFGCNLYSLKTTLDAACFLAFGNFTLHLTVKAASDWTSTSATARKVTLVLSMIQAHFICSFIEQHQSKTRKILIFFRIVPCSSKRIEWSALIWLEFLVNLYCPFIVHLEGLCFLISSNFYNVSL